MGQQIVQHPVPLILRDIMTKKSGGELIVKGRDFSRSLFFDKGHLIFAKTEVIEERLGEILFKIGKIDRPQFIEILKMIESKTATEKLGKILVQKKILTQRDLFFALLYQMRTIATSTFTLTSGEWDFVNKTPAIPADSRFDVELPGIITEGANKITNISYFKNKFHYMAVKASPIPEQLWEFLSTYEVNFYKELGGFKDLPCEEIIPKVKMSEEIFWKKIILFHLLNIVEFHAVGAEKELDKNVEEILELYEHLKMGKITYYELLGLKKTAGSQEIKDAYFSYAKKYHPDRISSAPDPEIKEKANFVFAEMNKAYETLSDSDKKRSYDSKGYKEESMEDTIQENLVERARMLYRKAKVLYTQKQHWEAVSLLDEAVRLDPGKAGYFLLLGLCQMNIPTMKRMAEKNLQKATELESWNVEAFTALGVLFLSENQVNRAEGFFKKALAVNPEHTLAKKKLAEIESSRTDKKKGGFSLFGKKK